MKRIRTIRLKGCDLDKRLSEEKNVSFFLEPEYVYYHLKDFVFLKKIDDYIFEGDAILTRINLEWGQIWNIAKMTL